MSFAVDIDEGSVQRLKAVLEDNRDLANVLDRAMPGATLSDNCNGSVTLHPAGTLPGEAEGLFPVPAGIRAIT